MAHGAFANPGGKPDRITAASENPESGTQRSRSQRVVRVPRVATVPNGLVPHQCPKVCVEGNCHDPEWPPRTAGRGSRAIHTHVRLISEQIASLRQAALGAGSGRRFQCCRRATGALSALTAPELATNLVQSTSPSMCSAVWARTRVGRRSCLLHAAVENRETRPCGGQVDGRRRGRLRQRRRARESSRRRRRRLFPRLVCLRRRR
jgi:hypothetical protein